MSSTTRLSRSGSTGPFGKNDRRIEILVSEELENAIITMATLSGKPKSEFVRDMIEKDLFGQFFMLKKVAGRD